MGTYRARRGLRPRGHLADMVIGTSIGALLAVLLWLATLWLLAR